MDNQDFPVVILVNSKPETLFSLRHFEYLIEREMGHDAANFFRRVVEDYEEEISNLREENGWLYDELQEARDE